MTRRADWKVNAHDRKHREHDRTYRPLDTTLFDDGPTKGTHLITERAGHAFVNPHITLNEETWYTTECRTCGWVSDPTYARGDADYMAGVHDATRHGAVTS